MRAGQLLLTGVVTAAMTAGTMISLQGQTPGASGTGDAKARAAWKMPRTAWGAPDLQGVWSNATITPLQRPTGKQEAFVTEEEAHALDAEAATRYDKRSADPKADIDAAYNQVWYDRGNTLATRRSSLIVDPPDGRLPPLTREGEIEAAAIVERRASLPRGPEDLDLSVRCMTRGAPKLPGGYNNNFQVLQTREYVAILQEMIHEVRIIPLDGRPHLPQAMRQYLGDSRGRWDGDTLVIETTNYHPGAGMNTYYCCGPSARNLRVVERLTRTDENTIRYEFTVEDPTVFTKPYKVELPWSRTEGPLYEYACHEGNYGMTGILSGARAEERKATGKSVAP